MGLQLPSIFPLGWQGCMLHGALKAVWLQGQFWSGLCLLAITGLQPGRGVVCLFHRTILKLFSACLLLVPRPSLRSFQKQHEKAALLLLTQHRHSLKGGTCAVCSMSEVTGGGRWLSLGINMQLVFTCFSIA